MKRKTKIIIAIVIILLVFVSAIIIITLNKISNSNEDTSSDVSNITSEISSDIESSYSEDIASNSTPEIIESEPEDSPYFPGYERPDTEFTTGDIDFVGIANLTTEQFDEKAMEKLAYLLDSAVQKKAIDYAKILDTSAKDKVAIEVHFKNGRITEYIAMFDVLNSHNFIRCMDKKSYDDIVNGAFV